MASMCRAPQVPLAWVGLVHDDLSNTWDDDERPDFNEILDSHLVEVYADADGNLSSIQARYAPLLDGLAVVRLETDAAQTHFKHARSPGLRPIGGVNANGDLVVILNPRLLMSEWEAHL